MFEIVAIYYLSSNHQDFFKNSRSIDMIFSSPSLNSSLFQVCQSNKDDEKETVKKFLHALDDNGEIYFDIRQIKILLQSDAYQFLNKKLETKKNDFLNFLEKNICYPQQNSCRSLKSICRLLIKMHIKQYPNDIKQLIIFPTISDHLQNFFNLQKSIRFRIRCVI